MKLVIVGGLGNMLGPASQHWLGKENVRVLRVLDRGTVGEFRDLCRAGWQQQQAQLVNSLKELIADGDFDGMIICAGKNGDDYHLIKACVEQLVIYKKGFFICHLSTVSCEFVVQTHRFCEQYGIEYANYPLTGGSIGALNATMLILASGSFSLYQKLEPILKYLGRPYYFDEKVATAAQVKLLGHTQLFYGLLGVSSAVNLDLRYHGYQQLQKQQATVFDFLSQGAGGTKQWEVAMKHGIANENWQQGFLLKHAVVDLIYVLQLMLQQNQPRFSVEPLLTLAFCFAYIATQEPDTTATQVIAKYWLPDKVAKLEQFVEQEFNHNLTQLQLLTKCVALLPEAIRSTVMLDIQY